MPSGERTQPTVRRWYTINRWFGRPYGPPIAFVLHTQSGGESGTLAEFVSSSSQFSAHYSVGLDGTLDCWIDPGDRAWSNGILEPGNTWAVVANACGVDPSLNPNHVTVTCETEDGGDLAQPVTDRQYAGVVCAVREARARFPTSLQYLVAHADISPQSRAQCPGDRWLSSGRLAQLADALGLKRVGS